MAKTKQCQRRGRPMGLGPRDFYTNPERYLLRPRVSTAKTTQNTIAGHPRLLSAIKPEVKSKTFHREADHLHVVIDHRHESNDEANENDKDQHISRPSKRQRTRNTRSTTTQGPSPVSDTQGQIALDNTTTRNSSSDSSAVSDENEPSDNDTTDVGDGPSASGADGVVDDQGRKDSAEAEIVVAFENNDDESSEGDEGREDSVESEIVVALGDSSDEPGDVVEGSDDGEEIAHSPKSGRV